MAKTNLLAVICLLALALTTVANHAVHLASYQMPRRVDINAMPTHFGQWKSIEEVPMSSDLQASLKSAVGYERTYISTNGISVKLLLLNATAYGDYHSPQACFPAQGWSIGSVRRLALDGQDVSEMTAQRDFMAVDVAWWFMADRAGKKSTARPASLMTRVGETLLNRPEGTSLLVRIVGVSESQGGSTVNSFAHDAMPALYELLRDHSRQT